MEAWLAGILVVIVVVGVAVGGMLVVRRSVQVSTLERHHDVAGSVYAAIGVMYAVLLAFAVVVVWNQYDDAVVRTATEANDLVNLFRGAEVFPPATRARIRSRIQSYVRAVIEDEWPAMADGKASAAAWTAFSALWRVYLETEPRNDRERAWYAESLRRLDELGDARRLRLLDSRAGVPSLLWATLLIGGALTIGFSYLFGTRNVWSQVVMTVALSGLIALILFLVSALAKPFGGAARIEPDAFHQLTEIFSRWNDAGPTP
ncbi:MAG TPA: DUF4239 domain-containing protein [Longimicrobiales bacterium]